MSDDFSSSTSTSGAIAINGSSLGNIERADDQDWFKVHLRGGAIYRFDAVGAGANPIDDTTLRIFDGAGNDTGFFDDDANNSFFAELFFSPRTDGDYFVDVGGFATHTGTYRVSATTDDFAGGTSTSGMVTVSGPRAKGTIETSFDQDWFAVNLVAGTHYDIVQDGVGVTTSLYDSFGNPLFFSNVHEFAATYTGRYYVGASISGTTTGGYDIGVVTAHANGDFNSNGRSGLLWRNANGELAQWSMDGGNITSGGDVTYNGLQVRPDASWTIAAITDFNFDAQSDILWRSDSGAVAEWLMNGAQVTASVTPSLANIPVQPDASWQVQAKPTQFI